MRAHAPAYPLWKRGNEMDQTIAFLGGDVRMSLLAQMMAAEGYDVCSWELTGAPKPLALCDALKADIIVLPLPAEKNGYLSGTELTMESLLRSLRREHRIFAGNVGNDASTLAQSLGLTITDYFASEELSVRNAIPTAEGAIEAAMKHTSVTLHGTPCLVLGFGRIGKVLAHDLSALGAKVSVSARKPVGPCVDRRVRLRAAAHEPPLRHAGGIPRGVQHRAASGIGRNAPCRAAAGLPAHRACEHERL